MGLAKNVQYIEDLNDKEPGLYSAWVSEVQCNEPLEEDGPSMSSGITNWLMGPNILL